MFKLTELGGSKKYIQWLKGWKPQKEVIQSYKWNTEYEYHLLIAEFNKTKYVYGFLCGSYFSINFVSFGQTYDSYDGECRSHFIPYRELQHIYDSNMDKFHNLEKIIQNMIKQDKLSLITLDLSRGSINFTFYNVMVLAIVINLNVKNVVDNIYEKHTNPTFIKLINYIYDFDSSVLVNPYILIKNHLCSKVIPVENFDEFKDNELIEIDINYNMSKISDNVPKFIDWSFIKPLTSSFFNNKRLKQTNTDITNFIKKDKTNLGIKCEKNIESYVGVLIVNQYVGHTISDIFTFHTKNVIEPCHIFELMYCLYTMHINNVIHGDICLTNITFTDNEKNDDGVNVYILTEYGEIDTYVFNNTPIKCYIIDFGKAIVSTKDSQKQQDRIKYILKKYSISDSRNIESIFPVLCLIDYIELGKCLKLLFKDTDIISKLESLSIELFKNNIDNPINDLEIQLFKELFNEYSFDKSDLEHNIISVKQLIR